MSVDPRLEGISWDTDSDSLNSQVNHLLRQVHKKVSFCPFYTMQPQSTLF